MDWTFSLLYLKPSWGPLCPWDKGQGTSYCSWHQSVRMHFLSCPPSNFMLEVTWFSVFLWILPGPRLGWGGHGQSDSSWWQSSPRPCEQDVPHPRWSPETRFSIHLRTCIFPPSMHHGHLKGQVLVASQIHLSFPYAGPSKRRSTAGPRSSVACVPVAQTKVQTSSWWFLCFLGGFSELQCSLRHLLGFVAARVC